MLFCFRERVISVLRTCSLWFKGKERLKHSSERCGQASVETAVLLPFLMFVLALLLQPSLILYTRSIMQEAAAEGCRVLMTYEGTSALSCEACEAYVKRRLVAVPNVSAFHIGGQDGWTIETEGNGSSKKVSVKVEGLIKPLPLLGIMASTLGEVRGNDVLLSVKVEQTARPSWVENAYESWVSEWD